MKTRTRLQLYSHAPSAQTRFTESGSSESLDCTKLASIVGSNAKRIAQAATLALHMELLPRFSRQEILLRRHENLHVLTHPAESCRSWARLFSIRLNSSASSRRSQPPRPQCRHHTDHTNQRKHHDHVDHPPGRPKVLLVVSRPRHTTTAKASSSS